MSPLGDRNQAHDAEPSRTRDCRKRNQAATTTAGGTHRAERVNAPQADPALTREHLVSSALALLTLTAAHQIRPLPWPLWTAWGAATLVAAAQSIRSRRRAAPTTWASDHVGAALSVRHATGRT
jgi:hypothetical protein